MYDVYAYSFSFPFITGCMYVHTHFIDRVKMMEKEGVCGIKTDDDEVFFCSFRESQGWNVIKCIALNVVVIGVVHGDFAIMYLFNFC